jgi:molybdopterin converting factor small subunit
LGRERKKIKVKVYLPPYLDVSRLDESGYVELSEGATLRDLFKELRIPFPPGTVQLCRVNYEKARLTDKLNDGDTVSFFSFISGG